MRNFNANSGLTILPERSIALADRAPAACTIAACVLRVSLRRSLVMVVSVAALLLMPTLALLTAFDLGDGHRMARDVALAVFGAAGILLAFTVTATAVYDRAAPGTLALILCKPVAPTALLLGRHAGLALLMAWFSLTIGTGVLLVERMAGPVHGVDWRVATLFGLALVGALTYAASANYRARTSFAACTVRALLPALLAAGAVVAVLHPAGGWCRFGQFFDRDLIEVCLLVTLFLQALTALASCLTAWVRLPLAICGYCGVLTAGALADYFAARVPAGIYGAAILRLLPAWQDFWMVDALTGGGVVGWGYVAAAAVYAVLLTAAFLTAMLTSRLVVD